MLIFTLSVPCEANQKTPARALSPDEAQLLVSRRPNEQVPEIQWRQRILKVTSVKQGNQTHAVVEVTGSYPKDDTRLLHRDREVPVNPTTREFRLRVPLQGRSTVLTLQAIDARGNVRDQKIGILFEGWDAFQKRHTAHTAPSSSKSAVTLLGITTGLGLTASSYSQSGSRGLDSMLLTLKTSYQTRLGTGPWDLGGNFFVSLLPISSNRTDVVARFFGMSARMGYAIPAIRDPWRVSIMAGGYYTTMFTSGVNLGYRNIAGPMLFPVVRHNLSPNTSVSAYVKYSPVSDGLSFLALSNRELAGGGAWTYRLSSGRTLSVSVDLADFKMNISPGAAVANRTYSAGMSLGW